MKFLNRLSNVRFNNQMFIFITFEKYLLFIKTILLSKLHLFIFINHLITLKNC